LQQMQEHDLYLKPTKWEFSKTKVEWLGMISMDTRKLKGISEWPVLTTVKQVRGFLGFGNFYWQFIKHHSEIARPLNDLTKKDQKFDWTETCQNTFDKLKRLFTEEPVQINPNCSKSSLMHQKTHQEPYSPKQILMGTDTHAHSFPKPSPKPNEIMKYMTENY
jgi:hypothetical protein